MKAFLRDLFSNQFSHFDLYGLFIGFLWIVMGEPASLSNCLTWVGYSLVIMGISGAIRHAMEIKP